METGNDYVFFGVDKRLKKASTHKEKDKVAMQRGPEMKDGESTGSILSFAYILDLVFHENFFTLKSHIQPGFCNLKSVV